MSACIRIALFSGFGYFAYHKKEDTDVISFTKIGDKPTTMLIRNASYYILSALIPLPHKSRLISTNSCPVSSYKPKHYEIYFTITMHV